MKNYFSKFSRRQKAYGLMVIGFLGLFIPFVPGIVFVLLGLGMLADKKSQLDVDLGQLVKNTGKNEDK